MECEGTSEAAMEAIPRSKSTAEAKCTSESTMTKSTTECEGTSESAMEAEPRSKSTVEAKRMSEAAMAESAVESKTAAAEAAAAEAGQVNVGAACAVTPIFPLNGQVSLVSAGDR
jgi:hypothetical protein